MESNPRPNAGVVHDPPEFTSYTACGWIVLPSPSVNTHLSALSMPTAANATVWNARHPARTARVVSSSEMARRAVFVLPLVSWTCLALELVFVQHNWYVVLMIPQLVDDRLPVGEWVATWPEVVDRFGTSAWRLHLLDGCWRALGALKLAGCRRAWIDGSFVTGKLHPGDIDGCYDPIGVDRSLLHPALRDLSPGRPAQKAEFGCEFFPNVVEAGSGEYFVQFFQRDRDGQRKGIIVIDLEVFES